ncbi:OLC1v1013486C1 [Oldenlandia corymbosa var. corymbosa]|uniref:OLC1v1013486C1 n=1 Tax=Oldenlandia corymbosa var. corymbosa TaxID=529605 RepID=A0AAV1DYC8_OLDCO|nr:OLC1v1013486C1 [Oldenlandia corymbosa var. corymbosa]
MGRVKRCRIHDLLYDFCLKKAKAGQFFHVLEGGYGFGCPSVIGQLVWLAYPAIRGDVREIPASIGNLSNLETLMIRTTESYSDPPPIPEGFWNLRKLKHFCYFLEDSVNNFLWGARLPNENLVNLSDLDELERISGAGFYYSGEERVVKKSPNLLELEFVHFGMMGADNLEFLKLKDVEFKGDLWRMEEDHFCKFRILKLDSSLLRWWNGCDDQFGCLEKLVLSNCCHLEEMPSCLENIRHFNTSTDQGHILFCGDNNVGEED